MNRKILKRCGTVLPIVCLIYVVIGFCVQKDITSLVPMNVRFSEARKEEAPGMEATPVPRNASGPEAAPVSAAAPPSTLQHRQNSSLPAVSTKRPKILATMDFLGNVLVRDKYEDGFTTAHEDMCPNNGRNLKLLILVTSAPNHARHREAIRRTWGSFHNRKDIVIAFIVGRTASSEVQVQIDKENSLYGDVVEAKFVDHYKNLTLKTVSIFQWISRYCDDAKFILKTDDDMFINVPLLLALVEVRKNDKRTAYGRLAKNWQPVRNKKSKYYIDKRVYSKSVYPNFLTGPAYLFTGDIVHDILKHALDAPFFVLEDVVIMGFVAEALKIRKISVSHFKNEKMSLKDPCKMKTVVSIHMVKFEEQFDIYKKTLDGKTKCKKR